MSAFIMLEREEEVFDTFGFTAGVFTNRGRTQNALNLLKARIEMRVLDYRD